MLKCDSAFVWDSPDLTNIYSKLLIPHKIYIEINSVEYKVMPLSLILLPVKNYGK